MASIDKLHTYTFDLDNSGSEDSSDVEIVIPHFNKPQIPLNTQRRRPVRRRLNEGGLSSPSLVLTEGPPPEKPAPSKIRASLSDSSIPPPQTPPPPPSPMIMNSDIFHDVTAQIQVMNEYQSQSSPLTQIPELRGQTHRKKNATPRVLFRVVKTRRNGMTLIFNFFSKSEHLYSAKCKGLSPSKIFIAEGPEVHLSSQSFAAVLCIGFGRRNYILRRASENGDEIMKVEMNPKREPIVYQRFFNVSINGVMELESMLPTVKSDGSYALKFGPYFTRQSIKNAILINKEGQKAFTVRRVGDDELELEMLTKIESLFLFAFGIISWICPF